MFRLINPLMNPFNENLYRMNDNFSKVKDTHISHSIWSLIHKALSI